MTIFIIITEFESGMNSGYLGQQVQFSGDSHF